MPVPPVEAQVTVMVLPLVMLVDDTFDVFTRAAFTVTVKSLFFIVPLLSLAFTRIVYVPADGIFTVTELVVE